MAEQEDVSEMSSTDDRAAVRPTVGIALGAGGAKGVAHVPMLEALDELGIKPARIAGCSIGAVIGAIQIMQQAIVERQLQIRPPDIYIKPDLNGIRTLHFNRAEEIYEQAQPAKRELKKKLRTQLG